MERSHWISDLHWVREGQQTRSQRTQAALLDAAHDLFAERGINATSVADIAERAGCSVGAVYHHFSDKTAVLYALFDRYALELQATSAAALDPQRWASANILDIITGYVAFSLDTAENRFKPLALEAIRVEPALAENFDKLLIDFDLGVLELLEARRDEVSHPNPTLAFHYVLEQLGIMVRARRTGASLPSRFGEQSDEAFLAETVRSIGAYLGLDTTKHVE